MKIPFSRPTIPKFTKSNGEAKSSRPSSPAQAARDAGMALTKKADATAKSVDDQFYSGKRTVKAEDFDKLYGYEFIIYNASDTKIIERITLPINPQSIEIDIPAATNLTVTMKGIVEETNAAPLRSIRISGTTGVIPGNASSAGTQTGTNPNNFFTDLVSYATRNTIREFNRTVGQVNRVAATLSGAPQKTNVLNYTSEELKKNQTIISGYQFFHSLGKFFDRYLSEKKSNRNLRLAFHMYKDQAYYDVSFGGYRLSKQPGSLEYFYSINLTAYRRRDWADIARKKPALPLATQIENINQINKILNGLRQSKTAVFAAMRVFAGIRSDIEATLITPVNELNIFLTTTISSARQAADYTGLIGSTTLKNAFTQAWSTNWKTGFSSDKEKNVNEALQTADGSYSTTGALKTATDGENTQAGDQAALDPENGAAATIFTTSPSENILNSEATDKLLKDVSIEDLQLSTEVLELIEKEELRISLLTADDFRLKRDAMQDFVASISEAYGGGNETFNRINGLPAPKQTFRTLGTEEVDALDKLNDMLMAYDTAIKYLDTLEPSDENDYLTFYGNQAREIGIPFDSSTSVFYAPYPYGASLQSLALLYLGDADRWTEIVAANALKPPYIDEEGFDVVFIGSGAGNTATVATSENLYVGQKVKITSNAANPSYRKIVAIDILTASECILTFDGDPNMANYTVNDNAKLSAYLPGTINSQSLIAIPSDTPVNVPGKIKTVPGVEDINGLNRLAKVDFLIEDSGDMVWSSNGDVKIAYGLTNIIQAAKIKVKTNRQSLVNDPTFGSAVDVGVNVADIDASAYLENLQNSFADDSRFESLEMATIQLVGPTFSVNILAKIADTSVYLPIEARVPI